MQLPWQHQHLSLQRIFTSSTAGDLTAAELGVDATDLSETNFLSLENIGRIGIEQFKLSVEYVRSFAENVQAYLLGHNLLQQCQYQGDATKLSDEIACLLIFCQLYQAAHNIPQQLDTFCVQQTEKARKP